MYRRVLILSCILFVALAQTGCGFILNIPQECKNETPFTGVHDIFWKKPQPERKVLGLVIPEIPRPKTSTKTEFLREWGKPDEIISTSEEMETWIYNKKLWCGIIPIVILPVPLILPVCDGFDRIDFRDNVATSLHTRSIVYGGVIFIPPGPAGADPACRYPLPPNKGVDSDAAKPAAQVTP